MIQSIDQLMPVHTWCDNRKDDRIFLFIDILLFGSWFQDQGGNPIDTNTHTHTHTHIERVKEREGEIE